MTLAHTEERSVTLHGAHAPEEALQRSVLALRAAGYKGIKADAGTMMVKGHRLSYDVSRVPATRVDRVDILLTRAPEGYRAEIIPGTGKGSSPGPNLLTGKSRKGAGDKATERIAQQFERLAPRERTPAPAERTTPASVEPPPTERPAAPPTGKPEAPWRTVFGRHHG